MPKQKRQQLGEVRDGLVMYPGGKTWHYVVRWRGVLRKGDTKCESRTAAVEWLKAEKEKWARLEQGIYHGPAPTLLEVWETWDRKKAPLVSKTHRRYMNGVVHQHTGEWMTRPITDLDGAAIGELKARYMSSTGKGFRKGGGHTTRKHSEGGWNKVLVQLRALVGFAVQEGILSERTFAARGQWLTPSARSDGFLWPEQVQRFLGVVDAMRKSVKGDLVPLPGIYCRLMLGCALREGEALNLEWDRVIWRQNAIVIADARTTSWRPKDRDKREIEMPTWLSDYLRKWWVSRGRPTEGLVMESRLGGALRESATKKAIARGGEELKIIGLHPHSLRATCATTWHEAGASLAEIAAMLGHEDEDTTLKHYIRRRPKGQTANQENASKLMGFPSSSLQVDGSVVKEEKK